MTYKASKLWPSDLWYIQNLFLELKGVLNHPRLSFFYFKSIVDLFWRGRQTYSDMNTEQCTYVVELILWSLDMYISMPSFKNA